MEKKELRQQQIKRLINYLHSQDKAVDDAILLKRIMNTNLLQKSQSIGITSSLSYEVDTSGLIAHLWDQGKDVYLARANNDPERSQDFVYYNYNSRVVKSKFGVEEIRDPDATIKNELDLIIVPGLAFALDSHQRLGFGGGYYDRFLAQHPQTETIAIVNNEMIFPQAVWPVEPTDIPVKTIVTPQAVLHE